MFSNEGASVAPPISSQSDPSAASSGCMSKDSAFGANFSVEQLRSEVISRSDHPEQAEDVSPPDAMIFWTTFGFTDLFRDDDESLSCLLPEGLIALSAATEDDDDNIIGVVKGNGPPVMAMKVNRLRHYLYRVGQPSDVPTAETLPQGVVLHEAGDVLPLPNGEDFEPERYQCQSMNELAAWCPSIPTVDDPVNLPVEVTTALTAFSLRGRATHFEENAVKAMPVLGDLCLAGQCTILYAAPNVGKTLVTLRLLLDAIDKRRIAPGNAYYVNADDSSEGFAQKMRLLDDVGAHTLAPGFRGFEPADLASHLRKMASTDTAKGVVVIIDTLKKFVDLMDKKVASAFGDACRQFTMKGGTVVALAHTNKNRSNSGKQTYAGVADIVQDFDAAYMITALDELGDGEETVVQFEAFKLRGAGSRQVAYAYANEPAISYEERLASVRPVDPEQFEEFERYQAEKSDAGTIAAIIACIGQGITQKMKLAKAAASRAHVPERSVIRALDTYGGDDPAKHRWRYSVKERGAKVYDLLAMPEAPADD